MRFVGVETVPDVCRPKSSWSGSGPHRIRLQSGRVLARLGRDALPLHTPMKHPLLICLSLAVVSVGSSRLLGSMCLFV